MQAQIQGSYTNTAKHGTKKIILYFCVLINIQLNNMNLSYAGNIVEGRGDINLCIQSSNVHKQYMTVKKDVDFWMCF